MSGGGTSTRVPICTDGEEWSKRACEDCAREGEELEKEEAGGATGVAGGGGGEEDGKEEEERRKIAEGWREEGEEGGWIKVTGKGGEKGVRKWIKVTGKGGGK